MTHINFCGPDWSSKSLPLVASEYKSIHRVKTSTHIGDTLTHEPNIAFDLK